MTDWIRLDSTLALPHVDPKQFSANEKRIPKLHQALHQKTLPGNEFLGWLELPEKTDPAKVQGIVDLADDLRSCSECFLHLGIGGSYLGSRSAIEFYQAFQPKTAHTLTIHYAGIDLSPASYYRLFQSLEDREICLNVISKSGSTLETSVAFQLCLDYMKKRYSAKELKKRIVVTTDPERGALLHLAKEAGYRTLPVNPDIGGRYSVLTAVGLFPMAMMGLPVQTLLDGARLAQENLLKPSNPANAYALIQQSLPSHKIMIEALASFEPALDYFTEWWKQLFGESLGKEGKGLFPAGIHYSTDLHSLGQYLQEGRRTILETFLTIDSLPKHLSQLSQPVTNTTLTKLNEQAWKATMAAHSDGGLPCLSLQMRDTTLFTLGYLYYFMMKACAMSGYLLGVNPFNQPGVEKYKSYMRNQQ